MPLTEYVFNTEAHPLPFPGSERDEQLRHKYALPPQDLDLKAGNFSSEVLQQAIDFYRAQLPRDLYVRTSQDSPDSAEGTEDAETGGLSEVERVPQVTGAGAADVDDRDDDTVSQSTEVGLGKADDGEALQHAPEV